MRKPTLQMALLQVTPPLPDPYEFASQIAASLRFIDENPAATARDLTPEMVRLWSISPQELDVLQDCFERVAETVNAVRVVGATGMAGADFGPRILSSLIIFAHIYLTYFRVEDFADLGNFAATYFKFQNFLHRSNRFDGRLFRLFDLENLDRTLDEIQENANP